MLDWTYAGVDYNIPGNGGRDCLKFLSGFQRVVESIFAMVISIKFITRGYRNIVIPKQLPNWIERTSIIKRLLLITHCLVFGIELGFKLATQQMIWVLNPCHIITIVQIYLLAAPPSIFTWATFRLHMYMLSGAPLALFFPVINTRLLVFEKEVYYLQHTLMLIVPIYLLRLGGIYTCEEMSDLSWAFVAIGILIFYHFIPLQIIASLSSVNLNNILCPAVSDPFSGQMYRIIAILHQAICLPFLGKLLNWIGLQISLDKSTSSTHLENSDNLDKMSNKQLSKESSCDQNISKITDDDTSSSRSESPAIHHTCNCKTVRLRNMENQSSNQDPDLSNSPVDSNPVF
ncbi:transmembrane protein 164 [Octopus bimaculoides]|uniref:Transmembrane protein 164 n=1 Tax=Octopus bimaculoides TaxID=37653 RepID=A0A0L8GTZ7_OCTBM|nr:transmembrane protein 164 [Octopus bimaculoides]XP_052823594.1 transmembrane protein 164 [Octopus bimaculoides]XP_052823595.1 transmembrane protein 164 [Octopus bimaculoides]|eukprot:XP_014778319.1 PREDICTED: transmembrane protein 164-like [Octopus bimaculoides]